MSQFESTFNAPYGQDAQPRRTSGLAITALVMSLVGIIPCCGFLTAPLGVILGAIAAFITGPASPRKGRGMAVTALILGLVFTIGWYAGGAWFSGKMMEGMMRGPQAALTAGFAGDIAGFKAAFHGAGAAATDDEAKAFLGALTERYGAMVSVRFDESQPPGQSFGQPNVPMPYVIQFASGPMNAEVELVFADQATGEMFFFAPRLGYITVFDAALGDLTFPSAAAAEAPSADVPLAAPAGP
jgi:hypothetical protein